LQIVNPELKTQDFLEKDALHGNEINDVSFRGKAFGKNALPF